MDKIFKSSEVKYEKLKYCNYCGSNDHNEDKCKKKDADDKIDKWESSKKK